MKKVILLAFIVSVSLILTPTKSYSIGNDPLVFTETSSTELTVTNNTLSGVNFGSVTNLGPDYWTWSLSGTAMTLYSGPLAWIETDTTQLLVDEIVLASGLHPPYFTDTIASSVIEGWSPSGQSRRSHTTMNAGGPYRCLQGQWQD